METLKRTVILLALSFRERLEAAVKCKDEFRRFKIQTWLCGVVILSASVSLSKYSHTTRVKKFNVFYDHDFTHDFLPTTHGLSEDIYGDYLSEMIGKV